MRRTLSAVLLVLVACETEGSRSGQGTTLSTRWASATAPEGYVALSVEESTRLKRSVLDSRPLSTVELAGRKSPEGLSKGVVWVMSSEHPDLENTRGLSIRMIAAALRESSEAQAKARGLPTPSADDFRLSDRPADKQIELDWVMRGPAGRALENRARMGLREDGVLVEAVCSCSGVGCARERCTFSLPSAGLLPIDTRFEVERTDDELEVLETSWASVRVPKVYERMTLAEEAYFPSGKVPWAKVEFASRKHPMGLSEGAMYLRSVDHEPEPNYGKTLLGVVERRREILVERQSESRRRNG